MSHKKNIINWGCAVVLPSVCILLLVYVVFTGFILPELEDTMLTRTKKSISRMVNWSSSVVENYHRLYLEGRMSLPEAKDRAKEQIRTMRYGNNSDEIFWIINYDHHLVMHPYLSDQENQELSDAAAFEGIYYAHEMIEQAKSSGDGFMQYVEHWKEEDDVKSLKVSYYKAYQPWGWIVGTSVTVHHVSSELAWLNQRLFRILSVALIIITLLTAMIISASYKLNKNKLSTDRALLKNERYLRNLITSMHDKVFVLDKDGNCKQCFGQDLSDPGGSEKIDNQTLPEPITKLHAQAVDDVDRTGSTHVYEYSIEENGSTLWFNVHVSPLREENGKILDYLWVIRNITSQKFLENGLALLNECSLAMGSDHKANIDAIVQATGNIIGGTYAMYNRYYPEENKLRTCAGWNLPYDFSFCDKPDGRICMNLILSDKHDPFVVEGVSHTSFAKSDPHIVLYGIESFVGYPVACDEQVVGALCVYDRSKRLFSPSEKRILSMLGKALGIEEKRLQVEATRKKHEYQFRSLFDSAFDGIAICSLDGRFIDANQSLLTMTGFSKKELLKGSVFDITPKHWHDSDREHLRTINDIGSITYEKECLHKDGSIFPVNISLWVMPDSQEQAPQLAIYIRDLTDNARAMEALQLESARLFSVFESIPAFVYLVDENYNVTFANKNFRDLFGDPENKKCYELIKSSSSPCEVCTAREAIHSRKSQCWEYITDDGKSYMIYDCPFFDIDGQPIALEMGIDITALKTAEKDLRISREKYRSIVDNIGIGIAIVDKDMQVVSINNRLREWFSHIDGDEQRLCREVFHYPAKEDECIDCLVKDTFDDGQVHESICGKSLKGEKEIQYFRMVASPIKEEDDEVDTVIVMVDNITDRLKTEKELRASEKQYRLLMESLIEGIWVVDSRGYTTFVNEPMAVMLGYTHEEMLNKHFYYFMDKRARKIARKNINESKKGVSHTIEFEFMRKDGSRIFTSVNTSPLWDDDGAFIGAIAGISDISKQKKADAEIKKFKEISDNANYGVVITDIEGNINYINDYFARMHGYSVQEFYGKHFSLFHIEKQMEQGHVIREELFEKGSFSAIETERVARDGSKFLMLMNGVLIKDEHGKPLYIAVTAIDITDHKRMEDDLLKAMKLESVGILAGGIAHDFNNLLTAILGNVSLALFDIDKSNPLYESLQHIEEASIRAKELSHQLLTFSKGGAPVKKKTSIEEIIRYAVQFTLKASGVSTSFYFQDGLHQVDVDKDQIIQVINNIVLNAKEAMPEGILVVRANNVIATEIQGVSLPDEQYVKISIEDSGPGIKPEIMEKIFDPFFSTKDKASGLGLSTSYSIIKKHNGHISVDSDAGHGTVISIYLPVAAKSLETSFQNRPTSECKGRILIMDDEEVVRNVISRLLRRLGYQTDCASEGGEALAMYKEAMEAENPYEVVIMDLVVPHGMGGKETMRQMLEFDPEAKGIVSSGYSNDPVMSEFRSYGFSAVVSKPVSFGELEQSLINLFK